MLAFKNTFAAAAKLAAKTETEAALSGFVELGGPDGGYGTLAVREGLNAVEASLKANGKNGLRHHIDHLAQIHPDDIPRFAKTETIAGFTAYWAMPNSYEMGLALPMLGQERWFQSYPINSIQDTGGITIGGSDWSVSDMNPFTSIVTGVTRADPKNLDRPPLNLNEAVSLDSMVANYTVNAAYVMHQEKLTGSLEVGKSADLIILDRNIFDIPIEQVRDTKVMQTFFKGKTVYLRP